MSTECKAHYLCVVAMFTILNRFIFYFSNGYIQLLHFH